MDFCLVVQIRPLDERKKTVERAGGILGGFIARRGRFLDHGG